jgi:hypothetical protein|tara:strand:+ start:4847 stop:4969 length:123 start_codon:yes stop_codon:yes gene_type:complete
MVISETNDELDGDEIVTVGGVVSATGSSSHDNKRKETIRT